MMFLILLSFTILYSLIQCQRTCDDFIQDQMGCIQQSVGTCQWNDNLNTCDEFISDSSGCSFLINKLSCQSQLIDENGARIYCRFGRTCQTALNLDYLQCTDILSKYACLGINSQNISCLWNETTSNCSSSLPPKVNKTISNLQTNFLDHTSSNLTLNQSALLVVQIQQSNPVICSQVNAFASVHSIDSYKNIIQYLSSSLNQTSIVAYYQELLSIPGCYMVNETTSQVILQNLKCDARGLNSQACQMIFTKGEQCAFIGNKCIRINAMSAQDSKKILIGLSCQTGINKATCLSIIGESGCYWDRNTSTCALLNVNYSNINCGHILVNEIPLLLSPSVCSLIAKAGQECFYIAKSSTTSSCSQLCRSPKLQTQIPCQNSAYGCQFSADSNGQMSCRFQSISQCGLIGQNQYSCLLAPEACMFQKSQCNSIDKSTFLVQLCTSGLNKFACLNLLNNYQTCYWDDASLTCNNLEINSNTRCIQMNNMSQVQVNPNSCRYITKEPCTYSQSNSTCSVDYTDALCTDIGLNKLACIQNFDNCQWQSNKGSCRLISIQDSSNQGLTYLQQYGICNQQLLVTSSVCIQISTSACMYDEINNNCVEPINDKEQVSSCDQVGINKIACLGVKYLACKWSDGCSTFTAAQGAVASCNSLQAVTPQVCALVSSSDKCVYDSLFSRCKTSVASNSSCQTLGLNIHACQFLNQDCYVQVQEYQFQCVPLSLYKYDRRDTLNQLRCQENYPTKSVCLMITTPGQFCRWNYQNKQCEQVVFTSSDLCSDFSLNINKNVCRGIHVNTALTVTQYSKCQIRRTSGGDNYCDPINPNIIFQQCGYEQAYTGSSKKYSSVINIHSCVAQSNQTAACFFDLSTYVCTQIPLFSYDLDDVILILNNLTCSQGNKQVCSRITKPGQSCFWIDSNNRCQNAVVTQPKSSCIESQLSSLFNSNVCSSITTKGLTCVWFHDLVNDITTCQDVAISNYDCGAPGLNIFACILNTLPQNQCLTYQQILGSFNDTKSQCQSNAIVSLGNSLITPDIAEATICESLFINRNGCLIQAQGNCRWLDNNCSTIDLNNLVCDTEGINKIICLSISLLVNNVPTYCQWDTASLNCMYIVVTSSTLCTSLIDINPYYCSQVTTDGCYYDRYNTKCALTSNIDQHNSQQLPSLNKIGCIFSSSTCQWTSNQCIELQQPFTVTECSPLFSKGLCAQVTYSQTQQCFFDSTLLQCSNLVIKPITNITRCASLSYLNNPAACRNITTEPCGYDEKTFSCTTTDLQLIIDQFKEANSSNYLNYLACLYVTDEFFYFNTTSKLCIKTPTNNVTTCTQYFQFAFCLQSTLNCQWVNYKCLDYTYGLQNCSSAPLMGLLVSKTVCTLYSVGMCQYDSINNLCVVNTNQTRVLCSDALNAYDCKYSVMNQNCYFDYYNTQTCLQVVASQLSSFTCEQIKYSNNNLCTQLTGEGEFCMQNVSSGNCIDVPLYTNTTCNSPISYQACIMLKTYGQQCQWANSKCQVANNLIILTCKDDVNIHTCLNIKSSACIWRGQKCDFYTQSDPLNLVSQQVCSIQNTNQGMKWNALTYSCIPPNLQYDKCNELGLNIVACYSLRTTSCRWINQQCIQFNDTTQKKCEQYVNVSAFSCSQISFESQLSCKYLNNSFCITSEPQKDVCSTLGLNVIGCLNVQSQSCFFDNSCKQQIILEQVTACMPTQGASQFLNKYSNALSCASVNYLGQYCKYNQSRVPTCQTDFKTNIDTCSTPGLNLQACVNVILNGAACINHFYLIQGQFSKQQCRYTNIIKSLCRDMQHANANSCNQLGNGEYCKYGLIEQGCLSSNENTPCQTQGLNQDGCGLITNNNKNCKWYQDYKSCSCQMEDQFKSINKALSQINSNLSDCSILTNVTCSKNFQCNYDGGHCRRRSCSDQNPDYCFGQKFYLFLVSTLSESVCYFDTERKVCQGAQSCLDLTDLNSEIRCNQFTINGVKCTNGKTLLGSSCRNKTCQDLSYDNCFGSLNGQVCFQQINTQTCVNKSCFDLKKIDCLNITLNGQSCNWNENKCHGQTLCQNLQLSGLQPQQAQELCNSTIIAGRHCNWQQVDLLSTQMECTINMCKMFGQSHSNCDGGEVSQSVCQLVSNTCVPCEEIPDVCSCKSSNGACGYSLVKGCYSIPCDQFHSEQSCTAATLNKRCTWQIQLQQCVVPCNKLSRFQCLMRQDQKLCYYDVILQSCLNGEKRTISLNPLAYLQRSIKSEILGILGIYMLQMTLFQ